MAWTGKTGGTIPVWIGKGNSSNQINLYGFRGRFSWILSTAYQRHPDKKEYLEAAESGVQFILNHAIDKDGRMFYRTAKDGTPLLKRRYYFTELFAVAALAAYGRAADSDHFIKIARGILNDVKTWTTAPSPKGAKWLPHGRPFTSLGHPMIMISVLQELRLSDPVRKDKYSQEIRQCIQEILPSHLIESEKCLVENLASGKPFFEHNEGRQLNPGHALELSWFILQEYRETGDKDLFEWGKKIFDWMWQWGWDAEYGGLFYFRDALNSPSSDYWHNMKFWWPHTEAIIASLLLSLLTGDVSYEDKFDQGLQWTLDHFPDKEYGEWFGYLHRDGTVSSEVKGNMFKGPFHIPRMQLICADFLKEL